MEAIAFISRKLSQEHISPRLAFAAIIVIAALSADSAVAQQTGPASVGTLDLPVCDGTVNVPGVTDQKQDAIVYKSDGVTEQCLFLYNGGGANVGQSATALPSSPPPITEQRAVSASDPFATSLIKWHVSNQTGLQVALKFFAKDRSTSWSRNKEYLLVPAGQVEHQTTRCRPGEVICYGAWLPANESRYWGVGFDNRYTCPACCNSCKNNDAFATLRP